MKEIINFLKKYTDGKQNTEKVEISVLQLNRVIKALEQDSTFDKISAEIEQMDFDFGDFYDHTDTIIEMVLEVIDRYKAGREK